MNTSGRYQQVLLGYDQWQGQRRGQGSRWGDCGHMPAANGFIRILIKAEESLIWDLPPWLKRRVVRRS